MFIFQCKNVDENSDSDFKFVANCYKVWIHEHDILLFLLVNSHNHCIFTMYMYRTKHIFRLSLYLAIQVLPLQKICQVTKLASWGTTLEQLLH